MRKRVIAIVGMALSVATCSRSVPAPETRRADGIPVIADENLADNVVVNEDAPVAR